MKKNISKFHKYFGLLAFIPTFFWCLSGLTHPIMAHFYKNTVVNEKYVNPKIEKNQLKISPEAIFVKNKITEFQNFNIITINKNNSVNYLVL